jgi:hypothetical protein
VQQRFRVRPQRVRATLSVEGRTLELFSQIANAHDTPLFVQSPRLFSQVYRYDLVRSSTTLHTCKYVGPKSIYRASTHFRSGASTTDCKVRVRNVQN